ncbi:type III secretion system export apparatus subunit SctT [Arsenophonus nasoniae]|uniref:Type III secretion system export apparatus subunit SctT n=1 Tax=Arsenophonus nasoniae TaxID=638 RepID=A0AA95GMR3_9GAMM|nr:type III secretion system export apparatus subunit SctT [Arsenophonus nasoniae]WGM01722.1 type III secretion system export apparatus subunit SctT [Arsenophonus nasoniae]
MMKLYLALQNSLLNYLLIFARLAPLFFMLPFLSDRILTNLSLKGIIILLLTLCLSPLIVMPTWQSTSQFIALSAVELFIGLTMGILMATPFWLASAIGEFIDNQRGASIGDMLDPTTGSESSSLASLINMFCVAWFLNQGGMIEFVATIIESYQQLPIGRPINYVDLFALGKWLTRFIMLAITLSAPLLIALFMLEIGLGVYSLFCPQLNAFSLSLTLKSIVAFGLLFILFNTTLPQAFISVLPPSISAIIIVGN